MSLHILGNIHPPTVYANSCQTVYITDEKMKWKKETKGKSFYITVMEVAKVYEVMFHCWKNQV